MNDSFLGGTDPRVELASGISPEEAAMARAIYGVEQPQGKPEGEPADLAARVESRPEYLFYRNTIHQRGEQMMEHDPFADPGQRAVSGAVLGRVVFDLGLHESEIETLRTAVREAAVADEATRATWRGEAGRLLESEFGDARGALALARKLVHRDSRVVELMDTNSIGSHPKVVAALARAARREAAAGRL